MTRERLNPFRLNDIAGTGVNRTTTLERLLAEERKALKATAVDSWGHHVATANIALLERQIEASRRNDEARAEREAEIAERREAENAAAEQHRQAVADAEANALRQEYRAANPHASDADVEAALPGLVERHRQERAERLLAEMRAKYVA